MKLLSYTGGELQTNSYLFQLPGGNILFDAPSGVVHWLQDKKLSVDLLLLTHSHFDHIPEAAQVKRVFKCKVGYHEACSAMDHEAHTLFPFEFGMAPEKVAADFLLSESDSVNFLGEDFQVLYVPGHHPGSLCFLLKSQKLLVGGDVLFAGSIGRWDLPGGDELVLLQGIKDKLLSLGDDVTVLPGHGPKTTIGHEKRYNALLGHC